MFVVGLISTIIILLYETITVLAASKDEVYNGIFLQIEKNFSESNLYPLVLLGDLVSAFFGLWVFISRFIIFPLVTLLFQKQYHKFYRLLLILII